MAFQIIDGVFEIQFLPQAQLVYNTLGNGQSGPYLAVESTAYFESYTHVLRGLKMLTEDTFPLSQYIVRYVNFTMRFIVRTRYRCCNNFSTRELVSVGSHSAVYEQQ